MSIQRAQRLAATEAVTEVSSASLKELREAVFFPESMPVDGILGLSHSTLEPALEAVRALGRAQGAALFVADDNRRVVLHLSTPDDSVLVHVPALCSAVARSGCVASGLVPCASRGLLGDELAFMAIPLFYEARLTGVLYLEGLTEMSARIEALVYRCAPMLACLLAHTAPSPWVEASVGGTACAEPGAGNR